MNPHQPSDEDLLRAHLAHKAGRIDAAGDLAPSAISRSRRQSRNRAVAGTVAAVAALAVAVPVAVSTLGHRGQTSIPASTTLSGPTTVPSTAPTNRAPAPTGVAPTTAAGTASTGPSPAASTTGGNSATNGPAPTAGPPAAEAALPAYAADGVIHDGTAATPVPAALRGTFTRFSRLADGSYLLDSSQGIVRLTRDGTSATVQPPATAFVVSEDRQRIAYLPQNGTGGLTVTDLAGAVLARVAGLTGDPVALMDDALWMWNGSGEADGTSNRVALSSAQRTQVQGVVVAAHGQTNRVLVDEGAGIGEPVCYRVLDSASTDLRQVSRFCTGQDFPSLGAFSSDGSLVISDGHGRTDAVYRVSDGRRVSTLAHTAGDRPAVRLAPDGQHVLVVTLQPDGTTGLLRCGISGTCTTAGLGTGGFALADN